MDTFVYTIVVPNSEGRGVRYFVVAEDKTRETTIARENDDTYAWVGPSTSLGLEEVLGLHLPYQLALAVRSGESAFVADLFVEGERYALYASLDAERKRMTYVVDADWKRNRGEPCFESLADVVRGAFSLQRDWVKARRFLQRLAVNVDVLKEPPPVEGGADSASAEL